MEICTITETRTFWKTDSKAQPHYKMKTKIYKVRTYIYIFLINFAYDIEKGLASNLEFQHWTAKN